jgi:hypothetical protein
MITQKYTRYKCKLLKALGEFKIGAKLVAIKMPKRIGVDKWDEENWYIYDNETLVLNSAGLGKDFELIEEKAEEPVEEKPKRKSKK